MSRQHEPTGRLQRIPASTRVWALLSASLIAVLVSLGLRGELICIASESSSMKPASTQPAEFPNTIGMKFVRIEPGEFMMGSPAGEKDRFDNETQHKVKLWNPARSRFSMQPMAIDTIY